MTQSNRFRFLLKTVDLLELTTFVTKYSFDKDSMKLFSLKIISVILFPANKHVHIFISLTSCFGRTPNAGLDSIDRLPIELVHQTLSHLNIATVFRFAFMSARKLKCAAFRGLDRSNTFLDNIGSQEIFKSAFCQTYPFKRQLWLLESRSQCQRAHQTITRATTAREQPTLWKPVRSRITTSNSKELNMDFFAWNAT
ncbi:hypothetical protein N7541_011977 [Penicillium brevicompactum]|uniref:F-box domain-containing protein n=1 Tax=Penicillium brevicompactum TaxID=5074 RepID=A0A9W9QRL2_PENBR|nr:hypothetical protein N7541_011977 [Penicillium brevicompactum]